MSLFPLSMQSVDAAYASKTLNRYFGLERLKTLRSRRGWIRSVLRPAPHLKPDRPHPPSSVFLAALASLDTGPTAGGQIPRFRCA